MLLLLLLLLLQLLMLRVRLGRMLLLRMLPVILLEAQRRSRRRNHRRRRRRVLKECLRRAGARQAVWPSGDRRVTRKKSRRQGACEARGPKEPAFKRANSTVGHKHTRTSERHCEKASSNPHPNSHTLTRAH